MSSSIEFMELFFSSALVSLAQRLPIRQANLLATSVQLDELARRGSPMARPISISGCSPVSCSNGRSR